MMAMPATAVTAIAVDVDADADTPRAQEPPCLGRSGGSDDEGEEYEDGARRGRGALPPLPLPLARLRPPSRAVVRRLVAALLLLRSRLHRLWGRIVWQRYHSPLGLRILRPHSPIDRVLRVWMEGIVAPATSARTPPPPPPPAAEGDGDGDAGGGEKDTEQCAALLLRALIALLLHEARDETDYNGLFRLLMERIDAHAELLQRRRNSEGAEEGGPAIMAWSAAMEARGVEDAQQTRIVGEMVFLGRDAVVSWPDAMKHCMNAQTRMLH